VRRNILSLFCLVIATAFSARAETIVAVTSGNRLLFVDSASPGTVSKTVTIMGLMSGERLHGIEFRPSAGILYALGETDIYRINTDTGAAHPVYPFDYFVPPDGTRFGFDFDPTHHRTDPLFEGDMMRVTSDTDKNLRFHPSIISYSFADADLHYAATDAHAGADPNVVGSAYTNSFSGSRATVLYDIDSNLDILTIQDPPNSGMLHTVGPLGVDTTDNVGFDISGSTGVAYASLTVGITTNLYAINLVSGAATTLGSIAGAGTLGTETIVGIAATVAPSSKLLNISTRGRVGQGEDILIGGFITRDGDSARFLLRAIGPSLAGAGIAAPLADPVLTLYDDNGAVFASNDDWRTSQETDIAATGLAPSNNAESAILATLLPRGYTAIVSAKDSNSGIAVVEVYQLP
jgi:hypothetical protein